MVVSELIVLLDGREVGRVFRDRYGKLSFTYSEAWQKAPDAYPISLSMPLALPEHGHKKIDPFLWGLLPDNQAVLDRWGHQFHVSARNSFGLIAAVGEDCAGAIQLVRPERLKAILSETPPEIRWLDEPEIAERLRLLRADHSAWRTPNDDGQFSLAGAQPKTALLLQNGRWGVPSGRMPTTHIFKPPTGEFNGHAENEHFCLQLASRLGLPVAESRVIHFGDEIAIVVKRYDRIPSETSFRRVHQEDMCQALGLPPSRKYQNEGGPSIRELVALLKAYSTSSEEDVKTFLDSISYNWLIAGTDAHAKNYALLIGSQGRVRLAPLFDLASVLPYQTINLHRAKLALSVGGEYHLLNIGLGNWQKLEKELHLDPMAITARVIDFAQQMPDHISDVGHQMATEGLDHPLVARLTAALIERSRKCSSMLNPK
jgi:serine/threonine-protein kinase HipA